MKNRKIIDFHTHPFLKKEQNICNHSEIGSMSLESTTKIFDELGVEKFCGSVISLEPFSGKWEQISLLNQTALEIAKKTSKYVPGYHVHPEFVRESIEEIERMSSIGVKLIGELVPYFHGWEYYADTRLYEILEAAEHFGAVVSFHATGNNDDIVDGITVSLLTFGAILMTTSAG